jgi:hypothetical protein
MLELKIAFKELDLIALITTFKNKRAKLINVVAELFFCFESSKGHSSSCEAKSTGPGKYQISPEPQSTVQCRFNHYFVKS